MRSIDPRMVAAVWLRNLTVYRHSWHVTILPNFFEPLLYLFSMGIGVGSYVAQGGGVEGREYLAFIGPGLLAAAAMNGASFEVTYNMFVKMNFGRIYDAFLATPATVEDLVVGLLRRQFLLRLQLPREGFHFVQGRLLRLEESFH